MFWSNKTHTNITLAMLGNMQVHCRLNPSHVPQNAVALLQHGYLALNSTNVLDPSRTHVKRSIIREEWLIVCILLYQRLGGKLMILPRAYRASTSMAFHKYPPYTCTAN